MGPETSPTDPAAAGAARREPPGADVCTDVSISMERANVIAGLMLPVLTVLVLAPFWLLHGWDALARGFGEVFRLRFFLPAFLVAIVLHEGLHGLGFLLFGRASRRDIHFGVHRATLSPFAGCRVPIRARAYRIAVVLPALVLGVLPLVAGFVWGWGAAAVWALVMLAAAGGDLIVLWAVRAVPPRAMVLDHPERVGCRVLPEGSGARG